MKYVKQANRISYDVYSLENGYSRCIQDMYERKYPVQTVRKLNEICANKKGSPAATISGKGRILV